MAGQVSSPAEPFYDILLEDADGRHLWLEGVPDLETARARMPVLSVQYSGMRLILWNHKTRTIVASTEGF